MHYCVRQNDKMREEYIKNVKGGRLKRLSAFLGDRDWNAEGGVSCSFASGIFMPCNAMHTHTQVNYLHMLITCNIRRAHTWLSPTHIHVYVMC